MKGQGFADLIARYVKVFRYAWARRSETDPPEMQRYEAQFLPAALALRDTPLHPAPRVTLWLIIAFAVIALAWAIFGRMEIVATAMGKVIPNDRTKVIQPMETAVVKAIHVREGQAVRAGELLLELDATVAMADSERLRSEATSARLESLRAQTMLAALSSGRFPTLADVDGLDPARMQVEQTQLSSQYQEYEARRMQLLAEIARRRAELSATEQQVLKLEQTVPIVRQRAADYEKLVKENFVSQHGYLEREQARIEQERDLASSRAKMAEIRAALEEAQQQHSALIAETRRRLLEQQNLADQRAASLEQELVKAEQRGRLMQVHSPVAGTVQQLAIHTIGGVVTSAQPLMVIVPHDNVLEVEAMLPNKDIGFVNAGQTATVKIETFPFTKYGTLHGTVSHVSSDAIQDEKLGLIYSTRVKLETDTLQVESKRVRVTPGMAVTVEVKTGSRRVIEYFLAPLLQYGNESLRER